MVIQPGFPNDNLPSDCASAASVVLSSLVGGDGSARVPAKINFKMWGIFIIRAFLQRACLLIISVAFAGQRHPRNFSFFRLASRPPRKSFQVLQLHAPWVCFNPSHPRLHWHFVFVPKRIRTSTDISPQLIKRDASRVQAVRRRPAIPSPHSLLMLPARRHRRSIGCRPRRPVARDKGSDQTRCRKPARRTHKLR